jgi:hypothetical protein
MVNQVVFQEHVNHRMIETNDEDAFLVIVHRRATCLCWPLRRSSLRSLGTPCPDDKCDSKVHAERSRFTRYFLSAISPERPTIV